MQNDAIRNATGAFLETFKNTMQQPIASGVFYNNNANTRGGEGVGHYNSGYAFDLSRQLSTANENRPYNFNIKMYIKV